MINLYEITKDDDYQALIEKVEIFEESEDYVGEKIGTDFWAAYSKLMSVLDTVTDLEIYDLIKYGSEEEWYTFSNVDYDYYDDLEEAKEELEEFHEKLEKLEEFLNEYLELVKTIQKQYKEAKETLYSIKEDILEEAYNDGKLEILGYNYMANDKKMFLVKFDGYLFHTTIYDFSNAKRLENIKTLIPAESNSKMTLQEDYENIENRKNLGESLYVINKQAKQIRDEYSDFLFRFSLINPYYNENYRDGDF